MQIVTTAPAAHVAADRARRTITGLVVPWGTFARVSTGQTVGFARGGLALSERAKLVLDHDPAQPVAVYQSASDTPDGLEATFRVPDGPRGDQVLAEAADGLRDGLSVAADLDTFDERDDGSIWVTASRGRHVALLSEPAFDSARVSAVAATAPPIPTTTTGVQMSDVTAPEITAAAPAPVEPAEVVTLTAAGAAVPLPPTAQAAPARVRDPYPYAMPHIMGGPSFVRDAWASMENPGSPEADRWRRGQLIAADPATQRAAIAHLAALPAEVAAATGTTTGETALVPPRYVPDRYVPLKAAKAPLYSVLTKFPTPDFTTIMVPRTTTETGLSGRPADEVTPIAPGDIGTVADTVTIDEVEGAYSFSRKLLMGSNPQIDRIALDAMDRAWLADVESRATTYFLGAGGHNTAQSGTYADGVGYINTLTGAFAAMATGPMVPTDVIPPSKEYVAAATAKDTAGRPLLVVGPRLNAPGEAAPGLQSVMVQGVPLHPGQYETANKTLVLDQSSDSAVAWVTPVMNFRLEWTTDATTGGNVKVLKLVKYSGVGFWTQYVAGVIVITNTTPITAMAEGLSDGVQLEEASEEAPKNHRGK